MVLRIIGILVCAAIGALLIDVACSRIAFVICRCLNTKDIPSDSPILKKDSICADTMCAKFMEGFTYLAVFAVLLWLIFHLIYVACDGQSSVVAYDIIVGLIMLIFAWIGISEGVQSCKNTIENIKGHYMHSHEEGNCYLKRS